VINRLGLFALLALAAACEPQRIGTNVQFACSHPRPDTTGWRRVPGPFPGYTVLMPPTLSQGAEGQDVMWSDESRRIRVFRRAWGAAQFETRDARHADYSSCWTRSGGMRTYVVVRRIEGGFQVTGWYRRPTSLPASAGYMDGVISGASRERADQVTFLRIVESVRAE
jgi:hypothetical protein